MTDTITRNSSPAVVLAGLVLVHRYDAGRPLATVVHPKLHGTGHMVAYRPAHDPSGMLTLVFDSAAAAHAASDLLVTEYTFTLASVEPAVDMEFIVGTPGGGGRLVPRIGEGDEEWILEVPFTRVPA